MGYDTEVLVLGGGSTGCGIARDLAMRGLEVTLVERGNLTHGTTGRMHGLLHSGGRYAVSDRASATECIEENEVLRDIAGHCVELTGGLFVQRPEDPDSYFREKLEGCRECGIPTRPLGSGGSRDRTLPRQRRETRHRGARRRGRSVPPLRGERTRCPDPRRSNRDPRGGNRPAARGRRRLRRTGSSRLGTRPANARRSGSTEEITAEYVVNATGAWAGQIAAMADLEVAVRPSKGVMTIMNVRQVDTVINRCRPKGDADIIVPTRRQPSSGRPTRRSPIPTTTRRRWEVDMMIDTLSELVPILSEARTIRSFWGVRPLYEPPGRATEDPTDITRDFFLLDHDERDGVSGVASIVGGKLTTYRAMAEDRRSRLRRTRCRRHLCHRRGTTPRQREPRATRGQDGRVRSPVADRSPKHEATRQSVAGRPRDRRAEPGDLCLRG